MTNDEMLEKIDLAMSVSLDTIMNSTYDPGKMKAAADAVQSLCYAKWQLLQPIADLVESQAAMPGLRDKSP